jgi:hypothetical protein
MKPHGTRFDEDVFDTTSRNVCYCKSKAPDTTGINNAALASSQTSQDALNWYKQEAARTQGQRDQSADLENQVAAQQLAADQQQTAAAGKTQAFMDTSVRPLEQTIIDKAQNFDSPEQQAAAADAATADVRAAQAGQQTARAQSLARMGYDPTVTTQTLGATDALQEAQAATAARRATQTQGVAMRADAANMGLGIGSSQVAQINSGTAAGQGATGAATGAVNVANSGAALMGQGFGTALQGQQVAGNLYGQAAQLSMNPGNSGLYGAIGQLGGAAISHYSSKKLKEPGAAMPDHMALDAMTDEATPTTSFTDSSAGEGGHYVPPANYMSPGKHTAAIVSMSNDVWKYKPGVADAAVHAGPYAEEARQKMGDKVAPGGKKLDMVESAKYNGNAIKELAARVDKLHKALGVTA